VHALISSTKLPPLPSKTTGITKSFKNAQESSYHFNFRKERVFNFESVEAAAYVRDYFLFKIFGLSAKRTNYSTANPR
jgi:hypothetical protein